VTEVGEPGTIGGPGRPIDTLDRLLNIGDSAVIEEVVTLPDEVNARPVRFGHDGVAAVGTGDAEVVYIALQREWLGDRDDHVRIVPPHPGAVIARSAASRGPGSLRATVRHERFRREPSLVDTGGGRINL
jgi:hypothetical protein